MKIGIPRGLSGIMDIAASPIYATAIGLVQFSSTVASDINLGTDREPPVSQAFRRMKGWFSEFF